MDIIYLCSSVLLLLLFFSLLFLPLPPLVLLQCRLLRSGALATFASTGTP